MILFRSSLRLDRSLIHFASELGKGWFGHVVLGSTSSTAVNFEPAYLYEPANSPQTENE